MAHTSYLHTPDAHEILSACGVQGALSIKTHKGAFSNRYKLEFWVYVGVTGWQGTAAQVPDITINLSGDKVGGRTWHARSSQRDCRHEQQQPGLPPCCV
jgi:hypothetical protein